MGTDSRVLMTWGGECGLKGVNVGKSSLWEEGPLVLEVDG